MPIPSDSLLSRVQCLSGHLENGVYAPHWPRSISCSSGPLIVWANHHPPRLAIFQKTTIHLALHLLQQISKSASITRRGRLGTLFNISSAGLLRERLQPFSTAVPTWATRRGGSGLSHWCTGHTWLTGRSDHWAILHQFAATSGHPYVSLSMAQTGYVIRSAATGTMRDSLCVVCSGGGGSIWPTSSVSRHASSMAHTDGS